jgi:hypothetical protein
MKMNVLIIIIIIIIIIIFYRRYQHRHHISLPLYPVALTWSIGHP